MTREMAHLLRQKALSAPDRVALVELEGERLPTTYAELNRGATAVAFRLQAAVERSARSNGRVAIYLPNGRRFIEAWFGALYAGFTVVPLPIGSAVPELRFRLEHARCVALLGDPPPEAVPPSVKVISIEGTPADSETAEFPLDAPQGAAMILYTSATTGVPKGVVISHASLWAHTQAIVDHALRLTADDRVLAALPLSHSFGCRMAMLAPIYAGATIVTLPRFHAAASFAALTSERITFLPAVPTMFSAWTRVRSDAPPPSLRLCLSAGAPLERDLQARAEAHLGVEIRQGYGLTEATFSTIDAPPSPRLPGLVGRAVFGVELRLVDEQGREVARGEVGEVWVRGQNVMAGYLDDPQATLSVLTDGWVHSGDLGMLDEEGRLTLVDCKKDLILRGGFNVYPAEVESVLSLHPEVDAAFVVGRPDPHHGEEVVAIVIPHEGRRPSPAALVDWAKARLASYKVPRAIAFIAAPPLGPSGKVQKRLLRAALLDGSLKTEGV